MTKFLLGLTIGVISTAITGINLAQQSAGEFINAACTAPKPPTSTSAQVICGAHNTKTALDSTQKNIAGFIDKLKTP